MRVFHIAIAIPLLILLAPGASGRVQKLLELRVHNGSNQARVNEPVSFGVPVAKTANLLTVEPLQVVTDGNVPVARQFKVLTRWGGPREDLTKPVRWALVTFKANVPANGTALYHLAIGSQPVPTDLWAADTATYIHVQTGPDTWFRVRKTSFRVFDSAVVDGTPLVSPGRLDLVRPNGSLAWPVVTETVLEEYAGFQSVRCVVRQRGTIDALRFTCRWFFHAGSSEVLVDFRLENPSAYGLFSTTIPDGQRYFDSLTLVQPVLGTNGFVATTDTTARPLTGSEWYEVTQDYRKEWQSISYDLWSGFKYFETKNGAQIGAGQRFRGALDLKGSNGGVTVAVDRFWQNFPKAISAEGGELRIGLWPDFGNGPVYKGQYATPNSPDGTDPQSLSKYRFEGGRWKTHRMLFSFHVGSRSPSAVAQVADRAEMPLIGSAPPAWIRTSGATGALWRERQEGADVGEQRWERFTSMLATDSAADPISLGQIGYPAFVRRGGTYGTQQSYGWENYGDLVWADGYCSQHYDWTQCFLLGYWRTGDYRLFNHGRDVAVSRRDYNQNHSTDTAETWRGAQFYEKGWWHGNYTPGQTSHNWLEGLLMYHVMTGDEAAREAAIENVNFILANPPKTWSGYYGTRIAGWSIDNLMAAHAYLGNPLYLEEARQGILRYQALEQQGGGMGCVINPANGQASSWMENILHVAACKYYLATGDQSVLPLLGRMRDWFKNEVCILPSGTYPNMTIPMVYESWSTTGGLNVSVHHCWAMSESFAYSAAVFQSTEDLLWSATYFQGAARFWQVGAGFNTVNVASASTYSDITFRPMMFPNSESKVLSNVIRWGSGYLGAKALLSAP